MTAEPRCELSVIIATHDRRELLRRCLEALSRQRKIRPGVSAGMEKASA